jgi:hypothetical protein
MKKIITKLSRRGGTVLSAVFITTLIIYGCRKTETKNPVVPTPISAARSWYENRYPGALASGVKTTSTSSNKAHDLSYWIKPDWVHAVTYERGGKKVTEVPVDPVAKFGSNLKLGSRKLNPAFSKSYYILLDDGLKYEGYVLTIIADSAYLAGDKKKLELNTYRKIQQDFSGSAIYFSPTGVYMGGYTYKEGKIVTESSDTAGDQNKTAVQSVSNIVKPNNMVQECTDWYIAYYIDGVFQYAEYLGTTCETHDDGNTGGGGSSTPPPPPPCPPGSHPGPPVIKPCIPLAVESVGGRVVVNYVPPPPPPGDPGVPPPTQTQCSVDGPAEPCPQDPCSQAKALTTDANFKNKMTDLKSKTGLPNEVGYTIGTNGSYSYVQGAAGAASITLSPSSPLSGYIHTHYNGTFPTFSGSDILAIYQLQQVSKIADLSTFTAGVVTGDGTTYMMKINDAAKFATFASNNLSTTAKFQSFEQGYSTRQLAYSLGGKDRVSSYELALLSSLKDSGITLMKGNSTFTSWNTESLNTNGNMVNDTIVSTNCN